MKNVAIKGSVVLALAIIFYQMGLIEAHGDTWEICAMPVVRMLLCMAWILLVEFANGLF